MVSEFFRSDMMHYIETNEGTLQTVYNMPQITWDIRGPIFEGLVTQRCLAMGVAVKLTGILNEVIRIPQGQNYFSGNALPSPFVKDGVHVPMMSNFPAVDMVWKSGSRLFGVQVYTSKIHKNNVFGKFLKMCHSAGWMDESQDVFLLYLCPFKECSFSFAPGNCNVETNGGITIGCITKESLPCLNTLQLINHRLNN